MRRTVKALGKTQTKSHNTDQTIIWRMGTADKPVACAGGVETDPACAPF